MKATWDLVLAWHIAACRFVSYVDSDITAEHFPYQHGDLAYKEVSVIPITQTMSTPDVLGLIDGQHRRPARLLHTLMWRIRNPVKKDDKLPFIVPIASEWNGHVTCIHGFGGFDDYSVIPIRALTLRSIDLHWTIGHAFATVPKE